MLFGLIKNDQEKQKKAEAQLLLLQKELESAVCAGDEKRVAVILSTTMEFPDAKTCKVNPNAKTDMDSNLHCAAKNNSLNILKSLIAYGGNVDVNNAGDLVKPIHTAARYGALDAVRFLLEKGANINAQTVEGRTPLHRAVIYNQTSMVLFLLEKGALAGICDKDGKTPLTHAKEAKFSHLVEILSNAKGFHEPANPSEDKGNEDSTRHNIEVLDAILKKRKHAECRPEWEKIDDFSIARTKEIKSSGLVLTEVFDFSARERITTTRLGGAISAPLREEFDKIAEKAPLEAALAELQTQGGRPDPQSVHVSSRQLKKFPESHG